MRSRLALVILFVLSQISVGLVAALWQSSQLTHVGASGNRTIVVGQGFTDVSPHQVVRTSTDVLYTVAPTCDSYPSCPGNSLRVYRADQPGAPASSTEQDSAHRPTNVGSAAIAIDGTDTIHALWNDRSGALNYRTFATATDLWSATTTVATTNWTGFGQGDEGVALALDAAGVPHVAYTTISNGLRRVGYLDKVGGNWSTPMIIDDAPLGSNQSALHPTLASYPNGDLLLAWLVGSFNYTPDGTIFFRTLDHQSGSWGARATIAGDTLMTTIDNGPSLLITADGTAHVAFLNAGTAANGNSTAGDYVHYYYNSGAGWVANHPGGGMQITHDPSLGPGANGGVRIYGHGWQGGAIDGHGNDLYYFEGGGGGATWGGWTLYASGSYDSSVTTRWAQFFQAHPEEVDIVYWADAYPTTLYVGSDGASEVPMPTPTTTPTTTTGAPTATPTSTTTVSATVTLAPTGTATAAPTNTPLATATATNTPTSTPTATATTMNTPTPTNTPNPTPTGTAPGSLTLQVSTGGDDVTQDGTSVSATANPEWIGMGGTTSASYLGLRFTNVALPSNAVITSAKVQFYSTQGQWISMSVTIAADATGNSAPFTSTSKPSQRSLTTTKVTYTDNTNWSTNTWYTSSDLSAVIQELVNRPDWRGGNSLSLILKGNGAAYARKFIKSFEGGGSNGTKTRDHIPVAGSDSGWLADSSGLSLYVSVSGKGTDSGLSCRPLHPKHRVADSTGACDLLHTDLSPPRAERQTADGGYP